MGETRRTLSLSMSHDEPRIAPPPPTSLSGSNGGSKADFRALIAELRDPVIILNRLGTICFTNPAAKAFLKHGLGARLEEYFNKHHNKKPNPQVRFHLKNGTDIILKLSRHHIQWIGKPAVLVSFQNVTQYVNAASMMRDSNLRTVSLLERVRDASFIVDVGEGNAPPYLSPQFDNLLRNERASWNKDPLLWRKFIHNDDRAIVVENVAKAIRERKPFAAEYRMQTADGNVIWVREKARITEDLEADLLMLSGCLLDITQERNASLTTATTNESAAIPEQMAQLEQSLAASRKAQTALQEERDQLEDILKKRTATLSEIQESLAQQTAENQHANETKDQLQARITELEIASKEYQTNQTHLEEQLEQRLSEIESINSQLATEAASRKEAEAHAEALEQRLTQAKSMTDELKAERERVEAERDQHAAELTAASEAMTQKIAEHKQSMASSDELQRKLSELEATIEKLTSTRSELDERLKQSERNLDQVNEQLSAESTQREQAEKRAEELQQHLADANEAIESLHSEQREIEASRDAHVAELVKAREALQQELALSAQTIEDLETSQRHLKDQWNQRAAELKKSSEDLRQEVAKARLAAEEAEKTQVRLKEEIGRQTVESEKTRTQLEQEITQSQNAAAKANASCKKLEVELEKQRDDLKTAQRELLLRANAAKRTEETLHEYRARFEDWAKKSVAELLVASEHLRHELTEEAQPEASQKPS